MAVTDDELRAAAQRRAALDTEAAEALAELRQLCLQAIAEGRAKHAVHKLTGVSRNTLDGWLAR